MDAYAIAAGYSPRRAFDLAHPSLPASAVLCAKLLALLWVVTGQVVFLRGDPVAFGGIAGLPLRGALWVQFAVLAQLVAVMTVVCSRFVRTGCAMLGAIILLLAALDQALFSNNRAFCALVLCMLALGENGMLARAQCALVYACAAIDKLLTFDWRSGVFLRSFTSDLCRVGELWSPGWSPGARLPVTCALSVALTRAPDFAIACSMAVIATEFAIAVGYVTRARFTALLAVLFHCAIFELTGSTFGIFFYAGLACSVLMLELEREPAPFARALPYYVAAAWLAGPWVRPWHAGLFALPVLVLTARSWREQRSQVAR